MVWAVGVRFPSETRDFSLLYSDQIGYGAHPVSSGVKQTGREADHSSPTNVEVKKTWIYTSTHPYASMA
jgi:hypothetical protein